MTAANRTTPSPNLVAAALLLALLAALLVFAGEDPALSAFPADTVVLLEVDRPVDRLDTLQAARWAEPIPGLMDAVATAAPTGAQADLAHAFTALLSRPDLRSSLEDAAGMSLAMGAVASPEAGRLTYVLALRSPAPEVQLAAFVELCRSLPGLEATAGADDVVRVRTASGAMWTGRAGAGWLVLADRDATAWVVPLHTALATGATPPYVTFSSVAEVAATAAELRSHQIRAVVHTAAARSALNGAGTPWARLLGSQLARLDRLGGARDLELDRVTVHLVGHLAPPSRDDPLHAVIIRAGPVDEPLRHLMPNALVRADIGVPAADWLTMVAGLAGEAAPGAADLARQVRSEFGAWSGLDPELDLLPHLGFGLAVGVLPPAADPGFWPLPRPVLLARVDSPEPVAEFLRQWFRWEVGAIAPFSGGAVSATVEVSSVNRWEVRGLRLESLVPLPLPSPATAVTDRLLVASPVRSAVEEVLLALAEEPPPPQTVPGVVEAFEVDLASWPGALEGAATLLRAAGLSPPPGLVTAAARLCAGFQPAVGTTRLSPDGSFACTVTLGAAVDRAGAAAATGRR